MADTLLWNENIEYDKPFVTDTSGTVSLPALRWIENIGKFFVEPEFSNENKFKLGSKFGNFFSTFMQTQVENSEYLTELQDINNQLIVYENKYNLDSASFYNKWLSDELPDTFENNVWSALYKAKLNLLNNNN